MYKGAARYNNYHQLEAEDRERDAEAKRAQAADQQLRELARRIDQLQIGQEIVGRVKGSTEPPVQVDIGGMIVLLLTGKVKPRQLVTVIIDRKEPTSHGIPRVVVRLKDPELG